MVAPISDAPVREDMLILFSSLDGNASTSRMWSGSFSPPAVAVGPCRTERTRGRRNWEGWYIAQHNKRET